VGTNTIFSQDPHQHILNQFIFLANEAFIYLSKKKVDTYIILCCIEFYMKQNIHGIEVDLVQNERLCTTKRMVMEHRERASKFGAPTSPF